jgi:histidinol phosphatase-like enzyme (inositol monophosphatase family)
MSQTDISEFLAIAEKAVDAANAVLCRYFRAPLELEGKDAPSPVVTRADRESEQMLRRVIGDAFPGHRIVGEEFGTTEGDGPNEEQFEWVLDPLDGTIAFVCGKPSFVILVALYRDGQPVLGVIDQPTLGERWVGVRGKPTRFNRQTTSSSGITALGEARLGTTDPVYFESSANADWFARLRRETRLTSTGGDGYAYGLLASGYLDLVIESGLAWHDAAALTSVIEGAGGSLTDFAGQPLRPGGEKYDVIAAATAELATAALALRD